MIPYIELETTAPRIKSDFQPPNDDLIQGLKRRRLRKERRMKRAIAVLVGYFIMAWMIYLIMVTARTTPKIWDPYDILGVPRVSDKPKSTLIEVTLLISCLPELR
jgi:translocation protein SEC63